MYDVNKYKQENLELKRAKQMQEILIGELENELDKKANYLRNFESKYVAHVPLKGKIRITSRFKTKHRPNHKGIDIVSDNDTVFAVRAGSAKIHYQTNSFGKLVGYGKYIRITDSIYTVEYGHLKEFLIKEKQVEKGEPIAIMGNSGTSTGKHLHLTMIAINPEKILWTK